MTRGRDTNVNRITIAALAGGLLLAVSCVQAKLPAAPAPSAAEQAAQADKAKAAAAKTAAELTAAEDRAVANYHKNKGQAATPAKAAGAQQ